MAIDTAASVEEIMAAAGNVEAMIEDACDGLETAIAEAVQDMENVLRTI